MAASKRKPREWWFVITKDGSVTFPESREAARCRVWDQRDKLVHVREVLKRKAVKKK